MNFYRIVFLALLLLLAACPQGPASGPVDIHWDRDACEHCRMVISDRRHAAEIRSGARREAMKFDDLGCALHWLQNQPEARQKEAEIWVMDSRDPRWLDARQAHYLGGQVTPMDYGFAAFAQTQPGSVNFTEARTRILANVHRHGGAVQEKK
jgi:nitrous oxide reductase accessory protein NosL